MSTAIGQSNYIIKVAKTTEGDFIVINGASYIGTYFDTINTMANSVTDFIKAKDMFMVSILDNFSKSSTIGYIKMNSTFTQTNEGMTRLVNPFVSKEEVDEKVKSVLSYALDKIEHP